MTTGTAPASPLRTAIVGLGKMGLNHARAIAALPEYELVAGCDLAPDLVDRFTEEFAGASGYGDYAAMLAAERPDVVVIPTNNVTHAPLTIQAAEASVRGIVCEKPMAISLGEGRAMLAACERNGTALIVNHQRRALPVFRTMRRLMEEGAIGPVREIRASCAGDVLSDGTHLVDTIRHLAGDADVSWVAGQIDLLPPAAADEPKGQGFDVSGGWRYGHPVEAGAVGIIQFETGLRAEIQCGTMQMRGRRYQDYEVFGETGRLWRESDFADPQLLIQTDDGAGWRPVPLADEDVFAANYRRFARTVARGEPHPLAGESAFKDLEIVMAIYESARVGGKVWLPLAQPAFPLTPEAGGVPQRA